MCIYIVTYVKDYIVMHFFMYTYCISYFTQTQKQKTLVYKGLLVYVVNACDFWFLMKGVPWSKVWQPP